ncbi:competence protein ComGF [Carnobacterium iners]|uniref:Competence protein ComGF n=1 Tax=Carnobacterium iners TaxID=1073423 RepID=A0A1X7NSF4_9LACT|nr:competence type IV pilus minor pilin ComGF [Carnobacterium iners]SEL16080.1 competence protein ComGF [Carnobacterium iners]SMH40598.1 competence protein ComGF [Carnobacterium iners]
MVVKLRKWIFSQPKLLPLKEEGFTLLESIVSLYVLVICILLISYAASQYQTIRKQIFLDRQLEWHLFLNQFEYDSKQLVFKDITTSRVRFEEFDRIGKTQRVIVYQKDLKKTNLIKTTELGGYQPLLMKVSKVTFSKKGNFLVIEVLFSNKESYKAQLKITQPVEELEK